MADLRTEPGSVMLVVDPLNRTPDEHVVALSTCFHKFTQLAFRPLFGLEMPVGNRLPEAAIGELEEDQTAITPNSVSIFANAVKLGDWVFAVRFSTTDPLQVVAFDTRSSPERMGVHQLRIDIREIPLYNATLRGQWFINQVIIKTIIPRLYPRLLELKVDKLGVGEFSWKLCKL